MELAPLPLSPHLLKRYRLAGRRKLRPDLLGGHLVRRQGQSLDFREYVHYQPGDDIRHVDWRASARFGQPEDLLRRSFVAEEQLTLVISLDTRASMQLPADLPKLRIAAWLAEALADIALQEGDRVILHRLFGAGGGATALRGVAMRGRIRPTLQELCAHPADETVNLGVLRRWMPPTAVWLILTDIYFEQQAARSLARGLRGAQDGMRWVLVTDLDSWPAERFRLGLGARRVEGPGLQVGRPLYEIDEPSLALVEERMRRHKQQFFAQARAAACDVAGWSWPEAAAVDGPAFFKQRFLHDAVLQRLFMRDRA